MPSRRPFDAGIEAQKRREEEGQVKSDGLREVNFVICISAVSQQSAQHRSPARLGRCVMKGKACPGFSGFPPPLSGLEAVAGVAGLSKQP